MMRCSSFADKSPIAEGIGRLVRCRLRTVAILACAYASCPALILCLASNAAYKVSAGMIVCPWN
jgi:hypothetical protein